MLKQTQKQLAVCSWSLKPDSPQTLIARLREIPITRVQLALNPLYYDPVWRDAPFILRDAGIKVVSGMIENGEENYSSPAAIRATGGLAPTLPFMNLFSRVTRYKIMMEQLGITDVSFHAGATPAVGDQWHEIIAYRLESLAKYFSFSEKNLLLETGQDPADTLSDFLDEVASPNTYVNFDPGNMLLYNMGDPIAALKKLLPRIAQVHIKDAVASGDPDVWGVEHPAGEGDVDWPAFFDILSNADYTGNLVIERECGENPVEDIRRAINYLSRFLE
ncbi:MAG: sugar phosphate isomerase/epimerase [Puniceicoccales bacterium]|jgi:hypothetical protein|nr:sugar phosphate isomerase/epimerase [Puniceicoccales bacterium]